MFSLVERYCPPPRPVPVVGFTGGVVVDGVGAGASAPRPRPVPAAGAGVVGGGVAGVDAGGVVVVGVVVGGGVVGNVNGTPAGCAGAAGAAMPLRTEPELPVFVTMAKPKAPSMNIAAQKSSSRA